MKRSRGAPVEGASLAPAASVARPRGGLATIVAVVLPAVLAGSGCAGLGPGGPPEATRENRLSLVAGLMRVEDRRDYDPLLVGRAAASKDPWVRNRAALACGRLRDVEASIFLPVLLRDPDASVRRAAAFAAGISEDRRLVPGLVKALADPDPETASAAATALGRLGGEAAEQALRLVLAGGDGPRAATALALWRSKDPALVPLLSTALRGAEPETRKAAAYALARTPRAGSEGELRGLLDDGDPEVAAWAARGLGLLGDERSSAGLERLARGTSPGPAIQALLALDRLAAKRHAAWKGRGSVGPYEISKGGTDTWIVRTPGEPQPLGLDPVDSRLRAAIAGVNAGHPGIEAAALTLLRRFADDVPVRDLLAAEAAAGGRSGGIALASLAAGDPDRAFGIAFPSGGAAPLDLRLGAAEALPLLPPDGLGAWLDALLGDPVARVRMEAVSRVPREAAASHASRLVRALADPDGSVKAVALDAAAPLASGPSADPAVREAWRAAYASALGSREPDLVASALDAAASLAEGGCALLAARRDDPDDLVRDRARRLLAQRCGEDPGRFVHRPFATRLSAADYRRLAATAESGRVLATFTTTRGSFTAELFPREAPMIVESFAALARKGFFDGTTIHRVVPDFVVQAGDPRGDGTGGPGYALRDERNALPYVRGRIGMALSGPDTGGSQWFATLSRQPHLDGAYTVFGEVTEGMNVVERIEQNDRLVTVRVREETREAPPGLGPGPG